MAKPQIIRFRQADTVPSVRQWKGWAGGMLSGAIAGWSGFVNAASEITTTVDLI
jgi:hypothetical protein